MDAIYVKIKDYPMLGRGWVGRLAHPHVLTRSLTLAGMVLLAFAMAQLSWRLLPHAPQMALQSPAMPRGQSGDRPFLAASQLGDLHLFGIAQALPGSAINAPETTLNLSLRGIFVLGTRRALAIIASGAEEQPYKTGDNLPGGAMVHEILPDRVILERSGRFETLTLPKESLENGVVPGAVGGAATPAAGAVSPGARLGDIRNRLKNNPAEVVGLNALQPVLENGQIKGYQLGDSPYSSALREAGLNPGDVVTRVNGISVTDQARAAEIFSQLSTSSHIDLEVERGGTAMAVSVDLSR